MTEQQYKTLLGHGYDVDPNRFPELNEQRKKVAAHNVGSTMKSSGHSGLLSDAVSLVLTVLAIIALLGFFALFGGR